MRERDSLKSALRAGTEALGDRLDIVVANAGIAPMADAGAWQDVLDVNLTGVYHTVDVASEADDQVRQRQRDGADQFGHGPGRGGHTDRRVGGLRGGQNTASSG